MSYEAYEKQDALKEVMKLLERAKDEIAGMRFTCIEEGIEQLVQDVDDEIRDLDDEVKEENDLENQALNNSYFSML